MIRTKIKPKTPKLPSRLMGGHMPDPPDDCLAPRIDILPAENNRRYVNTVFCRDCKKEKTCPRRQEFVQEWKAYRARLKNEYPTSP